MKKFLVLLVLLACAPYAAAGEMTADDLLAKHAKAIGGEKNIRAVKTIFMQGSYTMRGMPLQIRIYLVPPDKGYMEFSMNNTVMGSGGANGKDAWQTQMGQTYYLEGPAKKGMTRQMDLFPLLDYKKKGGQAKYAGEAKVEGKKAHKLQYATPEGDTAYFYFDAETFYLVKESDRSSSSLLSDYRKVGKLVMPYKFVSTGAEGQVVTTYDSMAVNIKVPDSLLVMPQGAKPMPKMPPGGGTGK